MEVHYILCGFTRMSVHILWVPYRYLLKDADDMKRLSTLGTVRTYGTCHRTRFGEGTILYLWNTGCLYRCFPFSEKRIADVAVRGSKLGVLLHRFLDTQVLKDWATLSKSKQVFLGILHGNIAVPILIMTCSLCFYKYVSSDVHTLPMYAV